MNRYEQLTFSQLPEVVVGYDKWGQLPGEDIHVHILDFDGQTMLSVVPHPVHEGEYQAQVMIGSETLYSSAHGWELVENAKSDAENTYEAIKHNYE